MNIFKRIFLLIDDFCYTVDFFKTPFKLNFSKKRSLISNKFGTAVSIMIIIFLLNEVFSSDMAQKTNPSVIIQKDFSQIRPKISLNQTNFELAVGLFDSGVLNHEIDSSEFKLTATQVKIIYTQKKKKANNTFKRHETIKNIEFRSCKTEDFPITGTKGIIETMKCLHDFELETNGYVNQQEYSAFRIDFSLCDNSTSEIPCKPKEIILEKLKNKFLGLHYIDYNVNYNNFTHPIIYTPQAALLSLDQKYSKWTDVFLTKFELLDDYDMIGSKSHISQGFFKNGINSDFRLKEEETSSLNRPIASFSFFSNPELQKNHRTYQKLTQLVSNIGGSASFLISIGFFFMSFINDWTLRVSLFNKLYDFEEASKDNKNNDKNNKNEKNIQKEELKEKQNFNEKFPFQKIEMKELKPDSFVLERYSMEEDLKKEKKYSKKKRKKLSIYQHIIFKIKSMLGLKFNENNEIYRIFDNGYKTIINGDFIYKKLQELECLKKIILSEKEIILLKNLKAPRLEFDLKKLSQNVLKNDYFGLFPIHQFDEKLKNFDSYNLGKLFQEWEFEKKIESQEQLKNNYWRKISIIFSNYKNS